jgi:copper chaperone CopZ
MGVVVADLFMKRFGLLMIGLGLGVTLKAADGEGALVKQTFYISGLECGSCVYMAQQALTETAGVAGVEVVQMLDSYAKVVYDPKRLSEHQIAQAVREAIPLHGMPYLASLKVRIPRYAEGANKARVQALFETWKKWLEVDVMDEREGELVIHFLPLAGRAAAGEEAKPEALGKAKAEPGVKDPKGWSLALLDEALSAPAPKGLGLEYQVVKPD